MDIRVPGAVLVAALVLAGCAQVDSTVDQATTAADKAAVCAEALGLADLNPLADPDRLKDRAADKERRLRELANDVSDRDVRNALFTMADSYLEIQRERVEDLTVVTNWAKRNTDRLDALRRACT